MPTRHASAVWEGTLTAGKGTMKLGSGAFSGEYSFGTRFEEKAGTNPEELIGAAHAGCFSMALAGLLSQAGHPARRIATSAKVTLEKSKDGFRITSIDLTAEADVPGMDRNEFEKQAEIAKANCPVSQALAGVKIQLQAKLV